VSERRRVDVFGAMFALIFDCDVDVEIGGWSMV